MTDREWAEELTARESNPETWDNPTDTEDFDGDAREVCASRIMQHDPSGQGHAWRALDVDGVPANIAEELACWVLEDDPEDGAQYIASNGLHYRCAP